MSDFKKIIFATHNSGKVKEMKEMLSDLGIEILSAEEAGIFDDVIEDGATFIENSLKKAKFVAEKSGCYAVADDTGLCIRELNGAPGVFSARWAGEGASREELLKYTLEKTKHLDNNNRQAYFETAVVLCSPAGEYQVFSGKIEGQLTLEPLGEPRVKLPYDQIFIPNGYEITFAQMSDAKKNSLSHRGLAFTKLKEYLKKII